MRIFILCIALGLSTTSQAATLDSDSVPVLLTNTEVQIECTDGINSMYNFEFRRADSQFRWLKGKYHWHPLPYFLLGLSQWWRIVPNVQNESYDEKFLMYMDSTIIKAEEIFDRGSKIEGAFILSAAYAFKGRLYAERHSWSKAAMAGKSALKYLDYSREQEEFGAEILFGDALYNYYSVWIRENYPMLKPIMMFFKEGDKEVGLKQLKEVANNAFFTRTEAQYFLMRIMATEENDIRSATFTSSYLHETFPNNAYFQRYYAKMLYTSGNRKAAESLSLDIIDKINQGYQGYEANSGRFAAFFLGEIYHKKRKGDLAVKYYTLAKKYGDEIGAQEKGYYLYAVIQLGKYAFQAGDKKESKEHFKTVKKYSSRGSKTYKIAKQHLKSF